MDNRFLKLIFKTVFYCFLFFLFFIFLFQVINKNKIIFGVYIGNNNFSNLNYIDAEKKLSELIKNFEEDQLNFILNNQQRTIKIRDLKISIKVKETLNKAFEIGHRKNLLQNLKDNIIGLTKNFQITPVFEINNDVLDKFLTDNFSKLTQESKNAYLKYDSNIGDWAIYAENRGSDLNKEKLIKDLTESIVSFTPKTIVLEIKKHTPQITINEAYEARNLALSIINLKPKIFYDDKFFELDKNTIAQFINFEIREINNQTKLIPVLNKNEIKNFLIQISPSIAREPKNAKLQFDNKTKKTEFISETDGIRLDIEKNVEEIFTLLNEGKKETHLSLIKIAPQITVDYLKKMGIQELLAIGYSNFYGSPQNRIFNIKLGAKKIDGLIIAPNEEFSFNKTIGEIGPDSGYLPELVIKNNKTAPDYGGGLCQVSTTLFRAAVLAGLKITERYPHAFPVVYYNPQGFDATIYPPSPDLKFVNDTPNHILILSRIEGNFLYFEIYGTNDGREVKIIGPNEYDKRPDGSMKAVLIQEIYKNKELVRRQIFYSVYKSPKLFPLERNPLE